MTSDLQTPTDKLTAGRRDAVLQFEAEVNCIAFNHTCLTLRGSHVNYITVDPIAGAQLGDRYVVVMSKVAIGGGE